MEEHDTQEEIIEETSAEDTFIPPSIDKQQILATNSYTYHSPIPATILSNKDTECVLGIDEAGRGPVLGPMVYGLFYLPTTLHHSLLSQTHGFADSKILTPATRSALFSSLCNPTTDLFSSCGWATRILSARDISSAMLKPAVYNLNAQAMDATIDLIQGVLDQGVNVKSCFIDTIGKPEVYQRRLEARFPGLEVTVAKKADSLFPVVSAASVCAKVTRDKALEVAYEYLTAAAAADDDLKGSSDAGWGSGYPSDQRCVDWLKGNVDPVFGWGGECRFSWGTVKDLLDRKEFGRRVEWPEDDSAVDGTVALGEYFRGKQDEGQKIANWWGVATEEVIF